MTASAKILLVEDEALLRLPMEETLIARGFDCRYASTLDGALEIVRSEDLKAAILDINIRGTAVFAVAREIMAKGIPFVFTTGYTEAVIPPEFAAAPHFQKPVDLEAVVNTVVAIAR